MDNKIFKMFKKISLFQTKESTYFTTLIVIVFFIAVYLRVHNFSGHWVWQDEITILDQVYSNYYAYTADAPAYQSTLTLFTFITGKYSIDHLRIFSIIISLLVPITGFIFTKKIGGKRAALLAMILLATLEHHVYNAVNLRPYTLFSTTSLLTYYLFFRYIEDKRFLLPLGLSIILCFFTHLLTLQIVIAITLCAFYIQFTEKKYNLKKIHNLFINKQSLLFSSTIIATGIIGTVWFWERPAGATHSALLEPANIADFIQLIIKLFPIGIGANLLPTVIGYILLFVGLKTIRKNNYNHFLFFITLFFTICFINWYTYGNRTNGGIDRYFAHIIVLCNCIIAIGLDKIIQILEKKTNKKLYLIMVIMVLLSLSVENITQSKYRFRRQDWQEYSSYTYNQEDVQGFFINYKRYIKSIALLMLKNQDQRPLITEENKKIFTVLPVKENDISLHYLPLQYNQLTEGIYMTDIKCVELEELLNNNKFNISVSDSTKTKPKTMSTIYRYCTLKKLPKI